LMSVNIAFWQLCIPLLDLQKGAIPKRAKAFGLVTNTFHRPTSIFVSVRNRPSIG